MRSPRWVLLAAMRSRPTSQLDTCRTKIVKFKRKRSAKDLDRQIRQVTSELHQRSRREN